MNPRVSIIMGSTSDLAIMEKAAKVLDDMGIPFEMNALSAHRTPAEVEAFAKSGCRERNRSHYRRSRYGCPSARSHCGHDTGAVIGVPINASLNGMDALLAITQMPPGIPVATVAINGAMNAGILAVQILAVGDRELKEKMIHFKESLKKKIVDANKELAAGEI